MTTVEQKRDVALMAHLLRRAGFGATAKELDYYMGMSYEEAVEELLSARPAPDELPTDLIRRYHVDQSDLRNGQAAAAQWVYRMVNTDAVLPEKMVPVLASRLRHRRHQAHPGPHGRQPG